MTSPKRSSSLEAKSIRSWSSASEMAVFDFDTARLRNGFFEAAVFDPLAAVEENRPSLAIAVEAALTSNRQIFL